MIQKYLYFSQKNILDASKSCFAKKNDKKMKISCFIDKHLIKYHPTIIWDFKQCL